MAYAEMIDILVEASELSAYWLENEISHRRRLGFCLPVTDAPSWKYRRHLQWYLETRMLYECATVSFDAISYACAFTNNSNETIQFKVL